MAVDAVAAPDPTLSVLGLRYARVALITSICSIRCSVLFNDHPSHVAVRRAREETSRPPRAIRFSSVISSPPPSPLAPLSRSSDNSSTPCFRCEAIGVDQRSHDVRGKFFLSINGRDGVSDYCLLHRNLNTDNISQRCASCFPEPGPVY